MSEDRWELASSQWRDPAQIGSAWEAAGGIDPTLLEHQVSGPFWDLLGELGITLLVGREYEHLLMSLGADARVGYLPIPHPGGIAVAPSGERAFVASTRNPNQLVELAPLDEEGAPLVPLRTRMLPGSLYLHDLAYVGGVLHANAVGQDAVVTLSLGDPGWERVWWPAAVDASGFDVNRLQLNSIAAGDDLSGSFFSASVARPGGRLPGDPEWEVDGRGVIFSGATREVIARGLTRPHSARLHEGTLWVDNSGYGEVGTIADGALEVAARLPGWTRGLCIRDGIAFVATSRVIPRFRRYAPGLDVDRSVCGVHALDVATGAVRATIMWPAGNQVFGVEAVASSRTLGFPFRSGAESDAVRTLFSTFKEPVPPS